MRRSEVPIGSRNNKVYGQKVVDYELSESDKEKHEMPHFLMRCNENVSMSLCVQNPDKHYTFLMQTSQNCVHTQVSTISKHYNFATQTSQNCVHEQVSTISKTLHFCYTNMSKLRP
jgi:hypothetical protein